MDDPLSLRAETNHRSCVIAMYPEITGGRCLPAIVVVANAFFSDFDRAGIIAKRNTRPMHITVAITDERVIDEVSGVVI